MSPRTPFLPRRHRAALGLSLTALYVAAAVGCGESPPTRVATFPVETQLTLRGQPMPGAFVTLHPRSPVEGVPTPRASIGSDGALRVTTFQAGDGAPEGEYVLTVQWHKPVRQGPDVVAGPNVVPPKYGSPRTSDIVVRVAAGANQVPPIRL